MTPPLEPAIKYVVILRSKHTGETTYLGRSFTTREEAQAYIDSDVCLRCNHAEISPKAADQIWLGRAKGWGVKDWARITPRTMAELRTLITEQPGIPYYVAAGEYLMEAKEHFGNDRKAFLIWVERNFGIGETQARRYIALAREVEAYKATPKTYTSLKDLARQHRAKKER